MAPLEGGLYNYICDAIAEGLATEVRVGGGARGVKVGYQTPAHCQTPPSHLPHAHQAELEARVTRSLTLLMDAGLFDPLDQQPYTSIPFDAINSPSAQVPQELFGIHQKHRPHLPASPSRSQGEEPRRHRPGARAAGQSSGRWCG